MTTNAMHDPRLDAEPDIFFFWSLRVLLDNWKNLNKEC